MDFEWIAIGLGDVLWITMAFVLGLGARFAGLPPLVGFLVAGFLLNSQGAADVELMQKLADLGITLLLFVVGMKLNLRTLIRPQVWAVTSIHTVLISVTFCLVIYLLALVGATAFSGLDIYQALLIAFALSFSSTVLVVKILDERGESTSLHGRIGIGVLLMQDIAAVIFLAVSTGKIPSPLAILLLLLFPLRRLFFAILKHIGHGELLVLFGFVLALGGAEIFEMVGMKGDLGALILGVSIASHPNADEMVRAMSKFKDFFLLGFFLSIGLSGQPDLSTFLVALMLIPLILVKSVLFFALFCLFKLRARTAYLATLNLSNYSEFGLIVIAIGVNNGWVGIEWLITLSIAMSLSFVISAILNTFSSQLYSSQGHWLNAFQRKRLIKDDQLIDLGEASIAIIGMGGVGSGAYEEMSQHVDETVIGIDFDPVTVSNQKAMGRRVIRGDPSDPDFWDRVKSSQKLGLVMLALPAENITLAILKQLEKTDFSGQIAAIARFEDEERSFKKAGATVVYNMYAEAGAGFVANVTQELQA